MPEELSHSQKSALLQRLQNLKQETETQLTSLHEHSAPVELDQQSVGRVSRIDAIQQQQMAQANEVQMQHQLKRIKLILANTDDFGYCRACEEPIGFPRLDIHPTAVYCIACQANKEAH